MAAEDTPAVIDQSVLTPETSASLNFSKQITDVTDSLTKRTNTKKKLTTDWRDIVKAFAKYDVTVSARRQSAERAYECLSNIKILITRDPKDMEIEQFITKSDNDAYRIRELSARPTTIKWLETKLPGIAELFESISEEYNNHGNRVSVDEKATKTARDEVRAVIDVLTADLEDLETTEDTLNDVDKYINTVEKIAKISAISQGRRV